MPRFRPPGRSLDRADRPATLLPMSVPTLSPRALNRSHLARQLLLERSAMPPLEAVEHLVGLQAQNPPSPYLALRARLRDFDPMALSGHMERREAVRMVLMRGTIHLVSARDAGALRPLVQPVLDRELYGNRSWGPGIAGVDVAPVLAFGRELVEQRPRALAELRAEIAARWPDLDAGTLAYAIRNLLPTIQVTPRGLWGRTGPVALTTLDHWTGRPMGDPGTIDDLLVRYLRAFGPATVADAAAWSRLTGLREPFERLRPGCARSGTSAAGSCSTSPTRRSSRATSPRRSGCCPTTTTRCSRTRTGRGCSFRSTGPTSVTT